MTTAHGWLCARGWRSTWDLQDTCKLLALRILSAKVVHYLFFFIVLPWSLKLILRGCLWFRLHSFLVIGLALWDRHYFPNLSNNRFLRLLIPISNKTSQHILSYSAFVLLVKQVDLLIEIRLDCIIQLIPCLVNWDIFNLRWVVKSVLLKLLGF